MYKSISAIKRNARHLSLDNFVCRRVLVKSGWKDISREVCLEDSDVDAIADIVTKGCRVDTLRRVRTALRNLDDIDSAGILSRLTYDKRHGWSYVAGQDYTAEMRTLRKVLIVGV
ncbi:MAG: hypothetical protein CMF22_12135 [Idiomarinaceae bacterium]|nr:hypothetical protein [Idiomarinaceae bacterium]|tara:strand:+ start:470 stop:814 length:345 start_codon:yes stop_codon:yes gene_type:complete